MTTSQRFHLILFSFKSFECVIYCPFKLFKVIMLSSSSKSLEERYSFLVILFRLLKGWLSPSCHCVLSETHKGLKTPYEFLVLFQTTSWKSFKALFRVYFLLPLFSYGKQFCVWFDALVVCSCFWEALYCCRCIDPFDMMSRPPCCGCPCWL